MSAFEAKAEWQSAKPLPAACAALLAATIGLFLIFAPPADAAVTAACTITGTARADVLRGTAGADVICGLGANDVIYGGGGNDVIRGGTGNDRISGDAGNDIISGGDGNDTLNGGNGNDKLIGDAGNDSISGLAGNDFLDGGIGSDQVSGGIGDDALKGGSGTDQISTGTGADTCASDSADRISGTCTIDRTGPTAAWLDVPATVTAGETFTATFSLKDPSGVDPTSPSGFIGGAPGWITSWCGFPVTASLESGTNTDGVWSITCPVPTNAVSDPYSIWINVADRFGNASPQLTADFAVVGGASDNKAPVITDVVIPTTAKPGDTITITWRAADPSGVKDTPYPWVYRPAPQFGVLYGEGIGQPVRTSGDAFDGAYSQTLRLPDNSVNGQYAVYISVRDELGNKTYEPYGSFAVN